MKIYRLIENDYVYNPNCGLLLNESKPGFNIDIDTYKNLRCTTKQQLIDEIIADTHMDNDTLNELLSKCPIIEEELELPNVPCVIVKCNELGDQWECDADRIPVLYFNSTKELKNFDPDYYYEVYVIENGKLILNEELSTYHKIGFEVE